MTRRRSMALRAAGLLLLTILFVGGAWWLFLRHVYEPPGAFTETLAPGPPPAPVAESTVRQVSPEPKGAAVVAVQGRVERSAVPGTWMPVREGDVLRPDESLRTGRASRADLAVDERARLTVAETTYLTVREVTRAVHRFQLVRGRLSADYDSEGERVLHIEGESGEAAVETHAARFSIVSEGVTLAVATETGRVNLGTPSGVVEVTAGEQATARPGLPPDAPGPSRARSCSSS